MLLVGWGSLPPYFPKAVIKRELHKTSTLYFMQKISLHQKKLLLNDKSQNVADTVPYLGFWVAIYLDNTLGL